MDWQPISTAPKDGEWIIATDGREVEPLAWVEDGYGDGYTGWAYGSTSWGGTLYDGTNDAAMKPTHWMPLPPPPYATKADSDGDDGA